MDEQPKKRIQFNLSTILLLMVIVGVVLGWWRSYQRAEIVEQRAVNAERRLEILERPDPSPWFSPPQFQPQSHAEIVEELRAWLAEEDRPVEAPPVERN